MKLKCLLISAFMLAFVMANAQSTSDVPFAKGNNMINATIGFGSPIYSGIGYTSRTPPISVSFEHIIKDGLINGKAGIGVGGYIGYTGAKWETTYQDYYFNGSTWLWRDVTYGWKYTNFIIGPRGIFHYNFAKKFDTYTGILIGYDVVSSKETGDWNLLNGVSTTKAKAGGIIWAWFIGGRYYFTDKFAGLAELGYGIAYFNLGVSFKF
jgi:hypothetical protein